METKHTPGPWTARESALSRNNDLWFISAGVSRVAETFSADNARLIAAAPELLAAGMSALEWCEQGGPMDWNQIVVFRDLLRAAIAKAEGRAQGEGE